MTKRRLTFQGYIDRSQPSTGIPPEENVPPLDPPVPVPNWRKKVLIGTKDLGVWWTESFVLDPGAPLGVPTWADVSTGLPVGVHELLDLTADPYGPEYRQYALYEDGVYVREAEGNWVRTLTNVDCETMMGATWTGGDFALDGMSCSINQDGYIAVLYNATGFLTWATGLFRSTDHGATWSLVTFVDGPTPLGSRFMSLEVGAYQGTSPHGAGQVMYAHGRVGAQARCGVSLDGGETWTNYSYAMGAGLWNAGLLVDPNDQSRCFLSAGNTALPAAVAVSLDHGQTWAIYDGNATMNIGGRSTWHHISVAMNAERTVRIGSAGGAVDWTSRTDDDGATWLETIAQWSDDDLGISLIQDSPDFLYLMRQSNNGSITTNWHTIWASDREGDVMIPKSGANCAIAGTGGGDSVPFDNGGIRGIVEMWPDGAGEDEPGVPGTPWTDPPIGRLPGPIPAHDHDLEAHAATHENGGADEIDVAGLSGLLADDQNPLAHAVDHENAGGDEIDVVGLSGLLADPQTPLAHAASHENAGGDEINVVGLSGLLADEQDAGWIKGRVVNGAAPNEDDILIWDDVAAEWVPGPVAAAINEHLHVYKENKSAECDGAKVNFLTANQFEPGTLIVMHNRAEEVDGVGEDYVELGTFDGFTLAVAPAGGDKLVVHYLAELL